jgi:HD superfamily phosphodiesterase
MGTRIEADTITPKLIEEMKSVFGDDTRRINHALKVLDYAQKIRAKEGGDALVINTAAILHDIGIHRAEDKYGSAAGKYQEIEGPPIAEKILKKYDFDGEIIKKVCRIIANHHSGKCPESMEFRCVWDADKIVNISEELRVMSENNLKNFISKVFKTETGRIIANKML